MTYHDHGDRPKPGEEKFQDLYRGWLMRKLVVAGLTKVGIFGCFFRCSGLGPQH